MMSCTGSVRMIWGDFKKSVELRTRHRTRRVDFRGSQRPDEFTRYGHRTREGGRWKSQNRKNVYLSPYVEEPLNSKVIKSFVPELKSRKCFRVSRFLCSMYICYEHSMYVSHIRIMGMVQSRLYSSPCQTRCRMFWATVSSAAVILSLNSLRFLRRGGH